jgi:two-component system, sensor histidine kinase and response regulator
MNTTTIKLLLVEDRQEDYLLAEYLLSQIRGSTFDLTWTQTYQEALAELSRCQHDICIVDYSLGTETGLDLAREAALRDCHVPFILLTGTGDEHIDHAAMEAGVMDYLVKGEISADLLDRSIRYSMTQARSLAQVRDYARELEQRNAELDAFSLTVAHDIRSPLATVIGNLSILSDEAADLDMEFTTTLDHSLAMAWRIDAIIGSLLTLAQLRKDEVLLNRVDMNAVVAGALQRGDAAITRRGVSVDVQGPLPAAVGHDLWLEHVFTNLIENAVKYIGKDNPAPRITIRGTIIDGSILDGRTVDDAAGLVRYEVQDNGRGIKPENLVQLFQMFSRFHATEAEGYGLGLSIVKRILNRLDGQMGVESVVGKGSTFWFTLPAATVAEPAAR